MTPDDERRAAAVPGVPMAERLRALADAPWSERGDAATMAALRAGHGREVSVEAYGVRLVIGGGQ